MNRTAILDRVGSGNKHIDLAYVEVASSESARDINRDIILEFIRSRQPVSRAGLSRLSGLQPSTVSNIVEQLLAEKWIVEGAVGRLPKGRPPTMVSLNDELVILVADIRPHKAVIAVVDLNGRVLAQETVRIFSNPDRSAAVIATAMQSMRQRYPGKSFEGVGVSLPGRVDPVTQRLILAPNLKWSNYDLKEALQNKLQLQVELDNDANACLLAELWSGRMDGTRNAVLVSLSEGIGTAILANGQLLTGMNGLAGEFGHISVDPSGPVCGCGKRGCWETLASSSAALRFYADLAPKSKMPTIQDLLKMTEEGDVRAIEAVRQQACHLGKGLRLITAALSPQLILITGALTTCWDRFGAIVAEELAAGMLVGRPPRLEIATEGELARLRGAAVVVLQRHSGYHRSIHPSGKSESAL